MAGPGGGPPRRSHTKSRNGCENCKRRHIRCDENFPQCRNCTKHKVRCPYNDVSVPDEKATTPDKPDLMWTPDIEATIDEWQRSGNFPYPGMVHSEPDPRSHTREELCLIYHAATVYHELKEIDAHDFTLWTRHIPTIIALGAVERFVMHALLGFSAEYIAFLTGCPLVGNMAYEHRGKALSGVHEAINDFSPANSDAILGASLVLSWQATDWRSWNHLILGTITVINEMGPWRHESQFADFIAENKIIPPPLPSPQPDRKPHEPTGEDLEAFQAVINQLAKVEAHLKQNKDEPQVIQQLSSFLKGARKVRPIQSIEDQFDRLRPLRTWLFWLPVRCLKENGATPSALVVIAHYYTAAMIMERLFPEIGSAYFGSLAVGPVEDIARSLMSMNVSGMDRDLHAPLSLIHSPLQTSREFRRRHGLPEPGPTPIFSQFDFSSFSPPNVYMIEHGTPPTTHPYMPYDGSPSFSWSTEDLPVQGPEQEFSSAGSPLALSSPFNRQFLGIPSPSYGGSSPYGGSPVYGGSPSYGAHSPASSTFDEGSIAYSDHDEFNSFAGGNPEYSHLGSVGPSNNFGVGTTSDQRAAPGFPPLNIPSLPPAAPEPSMTRQPGHHQPSPSSLWNTMQWLSIYSDASTTPLSASAPPSSIAPMHPLMHHRHNSSVSSAPLQVKREEEDE